MGEDDTPGATLSSGEMSEGGIVQTRVGRFGNWLIQFLVSTAVILIVAYVFEHLASKESVDKALELQGYLEKAISAFDPNQIVLYIGDAWIYVIGVVTNGLFNVLTLAISPSAAASILGVVKFLIYFLSAAFVIAVLPVVVVIGVMNEGHLIEGILAIGCWLAVAIGARLNVKGGSRGRSPKFPFFEIVVITFAFLWFIKLAMMGADWLLHLYIKLAGICLFGSTLSSCAYWCVSKRAEHTVSETAAHSAKHLLSNSIRHID